MKRSSIITPFDHAALPNPAIIRQIMKMQDFKLTTAEILYHMPDHPGVLQTFVWQKIDAAPRYPELTKFLDFWRREIEGPLHSVRVDGTSLVRANDIKVAGYFGRLGLQ